MIITGLLSVIFKLLDTLLIFEIPTLPDQVYEYIDTFFGYLETGASILANYTPLSYFLILLGIVLVVDSAILVYHLVMWIIRKIPFIGIE